jgi:antagonist of KipI
MHILKVIKSGLFTTVQDLGRSGYLKYGVPSSGAMDQFSLVVANCLVGNDPNVACLETTLIGPEFQVLRNTQIAITGGNCAPKINGTSVSMWQTLSTQENDLISFGRMQSGCRAYLSIRGGIDVPLILDSRSTYVRGGFGGANGRQLKTGDVIEGFDVASSINKYSMPEELIPQFKNHISAHVILGPQADMFTEEGITTFLSNQYVVTYESDRMGYRLEGPLITHKEKADIVSDALLPGAIQVPKSGKPIIVMRDAQTTGGYPKIAVAITPDISMLGQAKPNDTLEFCEITLEKAHEKIEEYNRLMNDLSHTLIRS